MFQKLLIGLVSLQTVMLILLFMKVDALQTREEDSDKPAVQAIGDLVTPAYLQRGEMVVTNSELDVRQLRQILREELSGVARSDELMAQTSTQESEIPVYDETELRYRQELVLEKIDLLKQQADVSSGELDGLLGEISQLSPEARTEMFGKLNQAINRGEITGHL